MALKAHTNKHSGDKPGFHHRNVVRLSGNQTVCSPWVFPPLVCEPAPSLFYSLIGVDQSTSDKAFSMIIHSNAHRFSITKNSILLKECVFVPVPPPIRDLSVDRDKPRGELSYSTLLILGCSVGAVCVWHDLRSVERLENK